MAFDDLLNLSLLLCGELQFFAQMVRHPVRGKARGVAREEPSAVEQVEMITGHADDEAGDEGDDDHHHGASLTRH